MARFNPLAVLVFCLVAMVTIASAAKKNYNMISEPVNRATTFPVSGYAEFEFSYATADPDPSSNADRNVWIAFKLGDTKLVGDSCYIGNGIVGNTEIAQSFNGQFTIVRAPVKADDFFQVVCRFKTPLSESTASKTTAYIGEFPTSNTPTDVTAAMNALINAAKQDDPSLANAPISDIIAKIADADSSVDVPDIVTEATVFAFHYQFEPEGRKLLNETEIDFVRKTHFAELNPQVQISSWEDVLVADHYADLDFSSGQPQVSKLHLILYTKGTTSQFDFRLGLFRRVLPVLDAFSNPLWLLDLTYTANWVYRSNCYNGIQDFQETGLDCGNPVLIGCGHCHKEQSTCTKTNECASSVCGKDGFCEVSLGTFYRPSSAFSTSLTIVAALVIFAVMSLM